MSQKFIVTFSNLSSYEKYKTDVVASGGTIVNDLGTILMGFTAIIPPAFVDLMRAGSLTEKGISTFEADSVATIKAL